ncbi:MAG: hypothetical protein EOP49_31210, partial [Sphingobacteriales bacterium]
AMPKRSSASDSTTSTAGDSTAVAANDSARTANDTASLSSILNKDKAGATTAAGSKDTNAIAAAEARKKYPIRSILYIPEELASNAGPVVGYIAKKDTAVLNNYLKMDALRNKLPNNVKFLYGAEEKTDRRNPNAPLRVYAIRTSTGVEESKLEGDRVVQARMDYNPVTGKPEVSMEMDATGAKIWKKMTGDNKKGLQYHERFFEMKDSLDKVAKYDKVAEMTTKYEAEKKQQQINLLNKENTIQKLSITKQKTTTGIIGGVFLISVLFGGMVYNRNKLKQRSLMQQKMLEQQDILTKAIVDAEENERRRIAGDLHDGVGQLFSAVKLNLNGLIDRITIEREEDRFLAENTLALVDESCKEVRIISHRMMPNMLLRSGIASDLKSFIEKIDADSLKVTLEASGFKDRLESNVETMLYRVIQETVSNVIKHAKASRLDISLNRDKDGIVAVITDNGKGFNVQQRDNFTGIGLKNIFTRIEYLKGTIDYDSAPGKGTTVNIWVPVM